jgi:AcrR family transcriptional regulator
MSSKPAAVTSTDARARAARARRDRTRRALLESAYVAFTERGWVDARMDDIAQAAGVTYVTAYNHFPSKQALIGHVYAAVMGPLLCAADSERPGRPARRTLADRLRCLTEVTDSHRALSAAFANAVQEHTARVGRRPLPDDGNDPRALVPIPPLLAAVIESGQRTGEFDRRRDALDVAEQLTYLLFLRCFTHPGEPAEQTASMLLAVALGVLSADPVVVESPRG